MSREGIKYYIAIGNVTDRGIGNLEVLDIIDKEDDTLLPVILRKIELNVPDLSSGQEIIIGCGEIDDDHFPPINEDDWDWEEV